MNSQRELRIGVVGCGRLTELGYLPAFAQLSGVKLAGVADVNQSRCRAIAPEVPGHQTIDDLIERGGIDALVVSTPTRCHLPNAIAAANAGLPALIEKPPGATLNEALLMNNLKPGPWIGFNRRFHPSIAEIKEHLPPRGEIYLELGSRIRSWKPLDSHDEVLLDLAPHLIDLARWLTNSEALAVRPRILEPHRVHLNLQLDWGHAQIRCSNQSYYRERIIVKDSQGHVNASYRQGGLMSGMAGCFQTNRENPLVNLLVRELEAFRLAIQGSSGVPLANSADGVAVMSVIDAVRRSATRGSTAPNWETVHHFN